MKKILFRALVLLSLIVFVTSPTWAGGVEYLRAGNEASKGGDYDKAIGLFTKAIESGELSQENLSRAYYNRGNDWGKKGDYDKAISDYTMAIEINPKHTYAYHNRGNAWDEKGEYDKAISDFNKTLELDPKSTYAYHNRGYSWKNKGDYDKAIADYTKVLEIDPKNVYAYNSLAWLKATCPVDRYRDGKQAVELAEKAVELDETASRLNTLAAAYAEAGRFQDAIKTQEKAIKLLEKEGETEDLAEFKEHLDSYKAGKPWREK